jgi:hypothetical protein
MKRPMKLVVLGIMGRSPFAGVAWQALHYLEGFRRLGHEVFYVEDTGTWPYDAELNTITDDCQYPLAYIARMMNWCGLADHWAYRSAVDGSTFGLSEAQVAHVWESADALINLTGATVLRDEHMRVPVRIYLETDPVLPEIEVAQGRQLTLELSKPTPTSSRSARTWARRTVAYRSGVFPTGPPASQLFSTGGHPRTPPPRATTAGSRPLRAGSSRARTSNGTAKPTPGVSISSSSSSSICRAGRSRPSSLPSRVKTRRSWAC